jgi:hypothetical protein
MRNFQGIETCHPPERTISIDSHASPSRRDQLVVKRRAVFFGSQIEFNEVIVHWLSQRLNLVGIIWNPVEAWKKTWRGRVDFLLSRLKRYGIFKTINEMLFYWYFHAFENDSDYAELQRQVIHPYWKNVERRRSSIKFIHVSDVNAPEALEFVMACKPDVGFALCINNYFGRQIRTIPKHGIFLWHEGITPEYRGLYSPFWAKDSRNKLPLVGKSGREGF